ncbi:MAG: type II toxin-antitoxin system VapC family toxin [Anaerolineales bacterium]
MKYLLDTSVVSELISEFPSASVTRFVDSLDQEDMFLSVITVGEIAKGIERLPNSQRKQELKKWLYEGLLVRFEGNIIPLDAEIFIRWGELSAKFERIGVVRSALDSLIAATVLAHRLVLVTTNESDFEHTGVEIVNPW